MTPGEFIDAALWFPEAEESEPFGPGPLVYKVARQKMFALLTGGSGSSGSSRASEDGPATVNLKCDPELALELRGQFPAVTPGWHMNKRHWNSVLLDGSVPDDELVEMLRHSYVLVARSLRRVDRDRVLAVLGEGAPPLGEGAPEVPAGTQD
ncbi:MmcQ/YjbR family DNA-binding protein [Nocardiopsis metallicus]|uniref:Putative DNA-binding protein (MmcQ/YjbR family) n=1 Tax=Nocardiopsis metallicus TaxID=179819 RepID=A0A840W6Z5_9ACTN|nr:MmcQ/YjbR family DNA-binding protein [Nocardiopsis metallicus]MBB5492779.1 putative DNA-binding protein (MmcQ/YjbR family) [Nocardiopsis metallicus]